MEDVSIVSTFNFANAKAISSTKTTAKDLDFRNILSDKASDLGLSQNKSTKNNINHDDRYKTNDDTVKLKPISKYQNKKYKDVKAKKADAKDQQVEDTKITQEGNNNVNKTQKSLKEKVSRIKELIDDPNILSDQSKQDELMKLVLQVQGLIQNKEADLNLLDSSTLNELNNLLNSNVVEQLSQSDSLLKQVSGDVEKDVQNLLVSINNNVDHKVVTDTIDDKIAKDNKGNNENNKIQQGDTSVEPDAETSNKNGVQTQTQTQTTDLKQVPVSTDGVGESKQVKNLVIQKIEQNENKLRTEGALDDNANAQNSSAKIELQNDSILNVDGQKNAQQTKEVVKDMSSILLNKDLADGNQIQKNIANTEDVKTEIKEAVLKTVQSVEFKSGSKASGSSLQSALDKTDNSYSNLNQLSPVPNNDFQNVILKNAVSKIPTANYKDVIEQVINSTKVVSTEDGVNEMVIKLNPENLGKLSLKLVTENGIIKANFIAENQKVKEIIEANFNQLKESFSNQGLNIGNLSVSVNSGDSAFREQMFNQGNAKRKFKNAEDELLDDSFSVKEIGSNEIENRYIHPQSSVEFMA